MKAQNNREVIEVISYFFSPSAVSHSFSRWHIFIVYENIHCGSAENTGEIRLL
jgi:hypothetical protein